MTMQTLQSRANRRGTLQSGSLSTSNPLNQRHPTQPDIKTHSPRMPNRNLGCLLTDSSRGPQALSPNSISMECPHWAYASPTHCKGANLRRCGVLFSPRTVNAAELRRFVYTRSVHSWNLAPRRLKLFHLPDIHAAKPRSPFRARLAMRRRRCDEAWYLSCFESFRRRKRFEVSARRLG